MLCIENAEKRQNPSNGKHSFFSVVTNSLEGSLTGKLNWVNVTQHCLMLLIPFERHDFTENIFLKYFIYIITWKMSRRVEAY